MDPKRYLEEIVAPTIAEYEADPLSVRRAFIACVVTFHAVDYLPGSRSVASLRKEFGSACPGFATVDRIAHAFKHVQTGHLANKTTPPLSAIEVVSRPPAMAGSAVVGLSRVPWQDQAPGICDGVR